MRELGAEWDANCIALLHWALRTVSILHLPLDWRCLSRGRGLCWVECYISKARGAEQAG